MNTPLIRILTLCIAALFLGAGGIEIRKRALKSVAMPENWQPAVTEEPSDEAREKERRELEQEAERARIEKQKDDARELARICSDLKREDVNNFPLVVDALLSDTRTLLTEWQKTAGPSHPLYQDSLTVASSCFTGSEPLDRYDIKTSSRIMRKVVQVADDVFQIAVNFKP